VDLVAPSNEAIAVLRSISRAGFAYAQTKKLASEAGWRTIDDELDLGYVRFAMQLDFGKEDRPLLTVEVSESGRLPRAIVSLFYFEEYDLEREPFDQAYQSLSEQLIGVLGLPSRSGEYSYPHRVGWQYSFN
jgi:hypothetical protein